jgi:hypothetical protein
MIDDRIKKHFMLKKVSKDKGHLNSPNNPGVH